MKELVKYLKSDIDLEREFAERLLSNEETFLEILKICNNKFNYGCGSYLFDGKNYKYYEGMFQKQILLYEIAKNSHKILEIGTYMGHSILIMLLANPKLQITSIDIDNTYTEPVIHHLNKKYNIKIDYHQGNSLDIIPKLETKYDLFHIDGTHNIDFVKEEFQLCKNLISTEVMNVIFDDYHSISQIENIIKNDHTILEKRTPNCEWYNTFLKIKI